MSNETSVGRFFECWQTYNERIIEVVRDFTAEGTAS
jgi:hypothetical protein